MPARPVRLPRVTYSTCQEASSILPNSPTQPQVWHSQRRQSWNPPPHDKHTLLGFLAGKQSLLNHRFILLEVQVGCLSANFPFLFSLQQTPLHNHRPYFLEQVCELQEEPQTYTYYICSLEQTTLPNHSPPIPSPYLSSYNKLFCVMKITTSQTNSTKNTQKICNFTPANQKYGRTHRHNTHTLPPSLGTTQKQELATTGH